MSRTKNQSRTRIDICSIKCPLISLISALKCCHKLFLLFIYFFPPSIELVLTEVNFFIIRRAIRSPPSPSFVLCRFINRPGAWLERNISGVRRMAPWNIAQPAESNLFYFIRYGGETNGSWFELSCPRSYWQRQVNLFFAIARPNEWSFNGMLNNKIIPFRSLQSAPMSFYSISPFMNWTIATNKVETIVITPVFYSPSSTSF